MKLSSLCAQENRKIFATGFWKYPPSEETLEAEKGGAAMPSKSHQPRRWARTHVLSIRAWSEERRASESLCSRVGGHGPPQLSSAPDSRWQEKGPQLGQKLDRKPWLTKFIAKSASRNPPKMPGDEEKCGSEADVTASLRLLLHLPHRELAGRAGAGEALQVLSCRCLQLDLLADDFTARWMQPT